MLRLVELSLFLIPFAAFAIWRVMAADGGPPVRVVVAAVCFLAVLAGFLVWLRHEEALPPDATYAPARLQDGRIVTGHPVPR